MPTFDVKFAELQAKITAVLAMLIAEFPDAAVRAREVTDIAEAVGVYTIVAVMLGLTAFILWGDDD